MTAPKMRVAYRVARAVCRAICRVYFRQRAFSAERVPLDGPVMLAANHESFLDPVAIGTEVHREVYYLAREPSLRTPVLGRVLRHFNCISIDQEGKVAAGGLRAGLSVLRSGKALMLFPEGTRTFDGSVQPFRSGIGLIAAKSGAPVVPVRVFGFYKIYGRHLRFPRPGRVIIKFGEPMRFEEKLAEIPGASSERLKEIYVEIAEEIHAAVLRLRPDADS